MRAICLLILAALALSPSLAQVPDPANLASPLKAPVNGPAVFVRVSHYVNAGDEKNVVRTRENTLREMTMDEHGRMLEDVRFETNGRPYRRTIFEYDSTGNLSRSVEENLETQRKTITTYASPTDFEVEYLDSAGLVQNYQIVRTDPEKGLGLDYFLNPDKTIDWGLKKKLDSLGNVVEQMDFFDEEEMNAEDLFEPKYEYVYDEKGRIIEQAELIGGEFSGKEYFVYDDAGRIVETTFYFERPDNLYHLKTFQYNEKGDVISWTWLNKSSYGFSRKWDYQYEYDHHGNWVVRKSRQDGYPSLTVERAIIYQE